MMLLTLRNKRQCAICGIPSLDARLGLLESGCANRECSIPAAILRSIAGVCRRAPQISRLHCAYERNTKHQTLEDDDDLISLRLQSKLYPMLTSLLPQFRSPSALLFMTRALSRERIVAINRPQLRPYRRKASLQAFEALNLLYIGKVARSRSCLLIKENRSSLTTQLTQRSQLPTLTRRCRCIDVLLAPTH